MLLINAGYAQLSIPADFSNDSMVCSKQECVEISLWQITLINNDFKLVRREGALELIFVIFVFVKIKAISCCIFGLITLYLHLLLKILVKILYCYEKNIPTFAKKEKKQAWLPRKNGYSKR